MTTLNPQLSRRLILFKKLFPDLKKVLHSKFRMKLFLSGRKWIRSNKLMSKKGYCEANCVLEAKDATCHFQKQPRPPLRLIANQGNISNSKSVSTANLTRGFELHATFLTSLRLHHGAV